MLFVRKYLNCFASLRLEKVLPVISAIIIAIILMVPGVAKAATALSGRVFDPSGNPVTSGSVMVAFKPINAASSSVTTASLDLNGYFTLTSLPSNISDGQCYLYVSYPELGYYSSDSYYMVAIENGVVVNSTTINFTLRDPQVKGRVFNPDGTTLATSNFRVIAWASHGSSGVNGSRGYYTLGDMTTGTSLTLGVATNANSKYAAPIVYQVGYNSANSLTINSSTYTMPASIDFTLVNKQFTGYVMQPDGTTAYTNSTAKIEIENTITHEKQYFFTYSGSGYNGAFNIGGLSDGSYTLTAIPPSNYTPNYTSSLKYSFTVSGGTISGLLSNIPFRLKPLSGRVFDPSGNPVTSGNVMVAFKPINAASSTVTTASLDSNGYFTLTSLSSNIPDGQCYLYVSYPELGYYSSDRNYIVTIENGSVVSSTTINFTLRDPQIKGRIFNPDGTTLATSNFRVIAWASHGSSGVNGSRGYYTLGDMTTGTSLTLGVATNANSNYAAPVVYQVDYSSTNSLTINSRTYTMPASVDFTLVNKQFTGYVMQPDGTTAYTNSTAKIEIENTTTHEKQYFFTYSGSGYNGAFNIGGLSDGSYTLTAIPPSNYTPNYTSSLKYSFTVSGGTISGLLSNIPFRLKVLSGRVLDPNGSPITSGSVMVTFRPINAASSSLSASLDSNGYFALTSLPSNIPDGQCYLYASYPELGYYSSDRDYIVTIENGAVVSSTTINFTLRDPQIKGRIFNPDGTTLATSNSRVIAWASPGSPGVNGRGGYYTLGDMTAGTSLTLGVATNANSNYAAPVVYQVNYISPTSLTINSSTYTMPASVDFTLVNKQFTGYVMQPDGTTAYTNSSAKIEIENTTTHEKQYFFTYSGSGYNGAFNIGGLSDGSYTLTAIPPSNNPQNYISSLKYSFNVSGGTISGLLSNIPFRIKALSGRVLDPNGNPVTSGSVMVTFRPINSTSPSVTAASLGSNGYFTLTSLPSNISDGQCYLNVSYPELGYYSSDRNYIVTIENGVVVSSTTINFTLRVPQIKGRIFNPDGTTLANSNFRVVDWSSNGSPVVNGRGGYYTLGDMTTGTYLTLGVATNANSNYAAPTVYQVNYISPTSLTINSSTYTMPASIDFTLVNKQFTGYVMQPDGTTEYTNSSAKIEIENTTTHEKHYFFSYAGSGYNGAFNIGGLSDGNYTLTAIPPSNNIRNYTSSLKYSFTVSGGTISGLLSNIPLRLKTITLAPPVLTPKGGSTLDKGDITVYWNIVEGATSYAYTVTDLDTNTQIVGNGTARGIVIQGTNFVIPSGLLIEGHRYKIFVASEDSVGNQYPSYSEITINAAPLISIYITNSKSINLLAIGDTYQLGAKVLPEDTTNKSVIWSVADGIGVVEVSNNGLVTALASGTATVRVTSALDATKYAECTLLVTSSAIKDNVWKITKYKAACPIEMIIYNNLNEVVATITDAGPQIQTFDFGYLYWTDESGDKVKTAYLFDDNYSVRIRGNGLGSMNFSITDLNTVGEIVRVRTYDNVPITNTAVINIGKDNQLAIDNNSDGINDMSLAPVTQKFDNIAPIITINEYNKAPTNKDIVVTASTNEGILNATSHTFTENGVFEFVAIDAANNISKQTVVITNIDKMPPVITIGDYLKTPTNKDITVTATINEGTLNATSHTFTENSSFEFVATDAAGNITKKDIAIANIDKVAPVIVISSPADNSKYILNQRVLASWSATDNSSVVASVYGSVYSGGVIDTSTVGSKLFTVKAADNAGNLTTKTVEYKVIYQFGGILQPVNNNDNKQDKNKADTDKAGSIIPVKFQLMDANNKYVTNAEAKVYYAALKNGAPGIESPAVSAGNAVDDNIFKYDPTSNQYVFNLSTKGWEPGSYQITIKLNDGMSYQVQINLR